VPAVGRIGSIIECVLYAEDWHVAGVGLNGCMLYLEHAVPGACAH
jgi:hypothetical protein